MEAPVEEFYVDRKSKKRIAILYHSEGKKEAGERGQGQCDGEFCVNFDCVLTMKWPSDIDASKWFEDHGFTRRECPIHGTTKVNKDHVCRVPVEGKGGYCRKNCLLPQDPKLFHVLHMVAHFASVAVIAETTKTCRNVVGRMVKRVARAALWNQANNRPRFRCMAVDETCIGKRKNGKGKRARKGGQCWMFTCTGINADGTAGETTWDATLERSLLNANAFISKCIDGRACTVYTDAAKCYYRVEELVRTHGVVNHSHGFINDKGEHTNHAEGAHGVVKDIVRAIWTSFGQTGVPVQQRWAPQDRSQEESGASPGSPELGE